MGPQRSLPGCLQLPLRWTHQSQALREPQGSGVAGHLASSRPLVCPPAFCSPLLAQLSCHCLQEGVPDLKLVSSRSGPPWTHSTLTLLSKACRDLNKEKKKATQPMLLFLPHPELGPETELQKEDRGVGWCVLFHKQEKCILKSSKI